MIEMSEKEFTVPAQVLISFEQRSKLTELRRRGVSSGALIRAALDKVLIDYASLLDGQRSDPSKKGVSE